MVLVRDRTQYLQLKHKLRPINQERKLVVVWQLRVQVHKHLMVTVRLACCLG